MLKSASLWLSLLVAVATCATPAGAYSVSPSVLMLRPAGDGSSGFIQLANRTPKPVAVELTLHPHHRDIEGRSFNGPAETTDDEFLVYPAQLVLLPGDETAVQVRWIGEPQIASERAYTLVARQVPIPPPVGASTEPEPTEGVRLDITVLMNYEVRIYVTPPGARAKIAVESVRDGTPTATGEPQLEIILANLGQARAVLADTSLVLSADPPGAASRSFVVPGSAVPALKAPILAGERRRLCVPRPAGLPPGPVRVSWTE